MQLLWARLRLLPHCPLLTHPGLAQPPTFSFIPLHHVSVLADNLFHFLLQQPNQLYQGAVPEYTFRVQTALLAWEVSKYFTTNTRTTEVHNQCIWEASWGTTYIFISCVNSVCSLCTPTTFQSLCGWTAISARRSLRTTFSLSEPAHPRTATTDIKSIYLLLPLYVHTCISVFYTYTRTRICNSVA